ncbi:MAG TPA: hypothetical protein VIY27_04305 [Myxococcota bacterium]
MTYRGTQRPRPRASAMAGLGSLGANTSEVLRLDVGPVPSRADAILSLRFHQGAVLDAAVTVQGVTRQEAPQVPDRIRAGLQDCGMRVEEAHWGSGSIAGKVYVQWRASSVGTLAVQHVNEVAAVLANVAHAFGPAARLTISRMRINPGPGRSYVYAYVEPSVGLPTTTCAAARETTIPAPAPRTFGPEPGPTTREPAGEGKPGALIAPPADAAEKPEGGAGKGSTGLVVAGVAVVAAIGITAALYATSRRGNRARLATNRRRRRR